MASQSDEMRGHIACAVDISPDVVEAGAEITLRAKVSCSPACDLRGHTLLVKDQAGAEAGRVELTEFDNTTNATREFVVKAPGVPGQHTWLAVCPAVVKRGVSYTEASTPISFTVKPHTTNLLAWDIPSPVVVAERFKMKVGIKCINGCRLTSKDFGIYDHEGARVARGTLSGDPWPGTTGVYVAEVELEAPAREGLYMWSAKGPESDTGTPHAEGSISFGVRVVSAPEYLVRVEVFDEVAQTPVKDARVVMHPYKAVTDERGVAEVLVAKGVYRLFVSQTKYVTFGLLVEVTADMTARAELELEPVTERN
jgi:hypothetical protein